MCLNIPLLHLYTFRIIKVFWWLEHFIIMKCLLLSMNIFLIQESVLLILTYQFLAVVFPGSIFFQNLCVPYLWLYSETGSFRKTWCWILLFDLTFGLWFLIVLFRPFIFNFVYWHIWNYIYYFAFGFLSISFITCMFQTFFLSLTELRVYESNLNPNFIRLFALWLLMGF